MAETATLGRLFWDSVKAHADNPAQTWNDGGWQTRTYQEFGRQVRRLAYGLWSLGLKKGDRIGVWSRNSIRWAEVDMANQSAGFVTVPAYDTLTGEKCAYILQDAGVKAVFVADAAMAARLRPYMGALKELKQVIVMTGVAPEGTTSYEAVLAAGDVRARAKPDDLDRAVAALDADDLASLVYTSGTTAEPKGAMLTHGNFASNTLAALQCVVITSKDTFLSFLPLSHVFERTGGHFAPYTAGAHVVFARSLEALADDMAYAKPTLMMAVPRLYEKVYAKIMDKVQNESVIKRFIFRKAIEAGKRTNSARANMQPVPAKLERAYRRFDGLVYRKIRERVGGRLRFFISGGAPLSRDIEEFFWAVGVPILQGYGLTETSPVTNVNRPGHVKFGSVGLAVPGVSVRIDETEWTPANPQPHPEGEVCVRGPNVMQGYWQLPKATREVFDDEGWFHTGDVGYVDDDGYLFITDRKKEILVLSNGKKVPPQPLENALKMQPNIQLACLVGDGRHYVSALIVPNWERLEQFATRNGIPTQDRGRLVADPRVVGLIEADVERVNGTLSRYEQVKKFWVMSQDWTVEGGELTPSMKLKRRVVEERFGALVERMYATESIRQG